MCFFSVTVFLNLFFSFDILQYSYDVLSVDFFLLFYLRFTGLPDSKDLYLSLILKILLLLL